MCPLPSDSEVLACAEADLHVLESTPVGPLTARKIEPEYRLTLTVPEAAKALGISDKTLTRRINDGTVPAHRLGANSRSMLIRVEDLMNALTPVPTVAMFRGTVNA